MALAMSFTSAGGAAPLPKQQFLLPQGGIRISAEGSLPLSGITPSGRLKLSFQRTDYKPFTPGGSAEESGHRFFGSSGHLKPNNLRNRSDTVLTHPE